MNAGNPDENPPAASAVAKLKIGPIELQGRSAQVAAVVLLVAIVALIVAMRPTLHMTLSGLIWIAFLVYWSVAARDSAAAKSSESPRSRQLHQLLLNGSLLLLFVPVPGLTRRFLPEAPLLVPVGLGVQIAFLLLAVWARRHLGRNWSGEVSIKTEHRLVRSGPYRLVRHPIYTAMLGMYLGTTIVSGQIHAVIGLALVVAAYARKLPMEESALRGAFGEEYDDYRRASWALIPGLY